METLNQTPTLSEKQQATASFQNYMFRNRESFKIPSWTNYRFGTSHDGITLWNEKSTSISFDELLLIQQFCENNGYTFACITRKTQDVSGYGGVQIEINICNQ